VSTTAETTGCCNLPEYSLSSTAAGQNPRRVTADAQQQHSIDWVIYVRLNMYLYTQKSVDLLFMYPVVVIYLNIIDVVIYLNMHIYIYIYIYMSELQYAKYSVKLTNVFPRLSDVHEGKPRKVGVI
jgi:hypothetical protein